MQGWQLAGWWFPLHVAWSETTRVFCSSKYATSTHIYIYTHRPSTFSYAGYTSTLYVFSIVFMLEALAKEIGESLGGLFHPMNFSSQLLPFHCFCWKYFKRCQAQVLSYASKTVGTGKGWCCSQLPRHPWHCRWAFLILFSVQMRWILWPFVASGRSQACRTARDWTQVISHICSHIAIF